MSEIIQRDSEGFVKLGIDGKLVNVQGHGVWVDENGDVHIRLGDAAGSQKLIIENASGSQVAKIDSYGLVESGGYDMLAMDTPTISGGAITVGARTAIEVDTEGGAATDDLDTINGGGTLRLLILKTANAARDVTVKHGTGNIYLNNATDFLMNSTYDRLFLIGHGSNWFELSRSSNGS